MERDNIVLVRLKSGETRPANRVNLARRLRASGKATALRKVRPGDPSTPFGQSSEAFAAKTATYDFKRYGPGYQ